MPAGTYCAALTQRFYVDQAVGFGHTNTANRSFAGVDTAPEGRDAALRLAVVDGAVAMTLMGAHGALRDSLPLPFAELWDLSAAQVSA